MSYVEAVANNGSTISVKLIKQTINATQLGSRIRQTQDVIVGIEIDGQHIPLNLDNSFHHPVTGMSYRLPR